MVNNNDQRTELKLRANINWDSVFKEKKKDRPSFSMVSKGCLKYHSKVV